LKDSVKNKFTVHDKLSTTTLKLCNKSKMITCTGAYAVGGTGEGEVIGTGGTG
jgi:hypothetical protein